MFSKGRSAVQCLFKKRLFSDVCCASHSGGVFDPSRQVVKSSISWAPDVFTDFRGQDSQSKQMLVSSGDGKGVNPMQSLLIALGSCASIGVVGILRKQKTPLDSLIIDVVGQRSTEGAMPWQTILVVFKAKGSGISKEKVEKAVALSIERHCGVHATLKGSVKIHTEVEIVS